MITRPSPTTIKRLAHLSPTSSSSSKYLLPSTRHLSTTRPQAAKNRIYTPVRRPEEFQTYLQNSTSSKTPLLTLWSASYCRTCQTISPLLLDLLRQGVGEEEGGVAYCEVEFDSMDIMDSDLGLTYGITSMPTLLAFHRGFAMQGTKGVDPRRMREREWLREWIRGEARRRDGGGPAGGMVDGPMGGRFGFKL